MIYYIKLKNIKKRQKNYYINENKFYKKLNKFKINYENNLNKINEINRKNNKSYNNISNINNSNNNINEMKIEKLLCYPSNRHYYIFLKNIYDWLLREEMINKAYIESFTTLNYFEDKLKDVKESIKRIKMMKHKISKKEELEKYIHMNKLLNIIIILNTIYLKNVRIERYKYSRFQLYYNALKFSCNIIKLELNMQDNLLSLIYQKK